MELRRIESPGVAEPERFRGPRTVRVDAKDTEPGARQRRDFGLKCRLHPTETGTSPFPPAQMIQRPTPRRRLMTTGILYPELRRLLDEGAQLVEVLPPQEYQEEHLPGAISIPLKRLDFDSTAQLDRRKAVVVYCWDAL